LIIEDYFGIFLLYDFLPLVWIWDLKNSLLIPEEFFDAKKLRTLPGANQNFSLRSSDNDLLGREVVVLVFWLKFQKFFTNYFFKSWGRINLKFGFWNLEFKLGRLDCISKDWKYLGLNPSLIGLI